MSTKISGTVSNMAVAYQSFEPPHGKTNRMTVRPAKTQISLGVRPVWSEYSLSAWRKIGSLATHWAHSEDSDQTWRMPRLIWVFAGRTSHFVGVVMRRLIWQLGWYSKSSSAFLPATFITMVLCIVKLFIFFFWFLPLTLSIYFYQNLYTCKLYLRYWNYRWNIGHKRWTLSSVTYKFDSIS